jgi:acyl-[acyl carrier protein]--UDP-N-acetylglucosamine O-acyltransferase
MNLKIGLNNNISQSVILHDNVVIGDNNFIGDNVIIYPNTIIGNNNKIFNGNIIGEFPVHTSLSDYDLSICKGVIIGDNNILHVKNSCPRIFISLQRCYNIIMVPRNIFINMSPAYIII